MCPVLNVNDKTEKRKISQSAIGAFCRILKNQNWLLDKSMGCQKMFDKFSTF